MTNLFENNTKETPNITFILGNGFDLSLHMKTSYSHIYSGYVDTPSASKVIVDFKTELGYRKPFDKWSDFEMGMAEYAQSLSSEEELIECVRDFKQYMVEHLRREDEQLQDLIRDDVYATQFVKELDRSFEKFYDSFSPNVRAEFEKVLGKSKTLSNYDVITFNYTKSLERLYIAKFMQQKVLMKLPLHIHGDLENGVVLGVDNVGQIKNTSYNLTKKGCRAFVKTIFNEQYDKSRVVTAKQMIEKSSVICTYGFSLGESDRVWVDLLIEWLRKDPNHHLVVYKYDTNIYNRCVFDELMDVEDEKKAELMRRLGINDVNIENQIHIPVGYDIFNFEFEEKEDNELMQHYNVFDT